MSAGKTTSELYTERDSKIGFNQCKYKILKFV